MAGVNREKIISLEEVHGDQIPPLRERRAAKALDLLCDAVSSPAAKSNGLSEIDIINAIKKLKPSFEEPKYHDSCGEYTPVWNISSRQEFQEIALDPKEIEGLASILPFKGNSNETNSGNTLIPEILFTMKMLDYDAFKFLLFTSHLSGYPAVGVLLCEILTDSTLLEKARQFLDIEATDQKREILLDYLMWKLPNLVNLRIAHFASLCGQYIATIVPKEIGHIYVQETKFSESDATALVTVISHSSVVKKLYLRSCHLDSEPIAVLQDGLKNFDVKIRSLDIRGNQDTDEEGFRFLGNIVKNHAVEELDMSECGLSFGKLTSFDNASGNAKIRSLNIARNRDIEEEGFRCLGNIVQKHAVQELSISDCDLKSGKLKSFDSTSGNAKICRLDVSLNSFIEKDGFHHLGNIVKKHAVEEFDMHACGLESQKLMSFKNASGSGKIRSFNISENEGINEEGFRCLANMVMEHAVEELGMSDCGLSVMTRRGGKISNKDVCLHFSENAVKDPTRVWFQLDVPGINDDTMEEFLPISPVLKLFPCMELQTPVQVTITTWVDGESNNDTPAIVFYRKDGTDNWQLDQDVIVGSDGKAIFSTTKFCAYIIVIKAYITRSFKVLSCLFENTQKKQLVNRLVLNCDKCIEKLRKDMSDRNFKKACFEDITIAVKFGDKIEVEICGIIVNGSHDSHPSKTAHITKKFLRGQEHVAQDFSLSPSINKLIDFTYRTTHWRDKKKIKVMERTVRFNPGTSDSPYNQVIVGHGLTMGGDLVMGENRSYDGY